jgi:psiF repeat-containing protein
VRHTTWMVAVGAALAVLAGQVSLADNSQQEKMKTCNADATAHNLKGEDRQKFMQKCLSHEEAAPAKTNSQQEKMKTCNADATAKGLSGDARQKFMSTCLKGPTASH